MRQFLGQVKGLTMPNTICGLMTLWSELTVVQECVYLFVQGIHHVHSKTKSKELNNGINSWRFKAIYLLWLAGWEIRPFSDESNFLMAHTVI